MSRSDPSPPADRGSRLRRYADRFEFDRAVLFVLASRFWQLAAGPVTALLIVTHFSKDLRGFFYLFASLTALQSFVELGLHMVLLNLFGHAWSGLRWDSQTRELVGEPAAVARFRGLDSFARRWYAAASLLLAVFVGTAGTFFFAQADSAIDWRLPWWGLVALTAASLALMPSVTLLESCGHFEDVNRYRFAQAVCGNLAVWPLILAGAGLWTTVAAAAVKLAGEVLLTRVRFGRFLAGVRLAGAPRGLDWRREVWPLQWRVGVQSLFLYFSSAVFAPIIFQYRGLEEAGRFGMTWAILSVLQSAAFGWVQTRVPRLAQFSAEGGDGEFQRLWRRVTAASLLMLAAGGAAVVGGLAVLGAAADHPSIFGPVSDLAGRLADGFLNPWTAAPFAAGVIAWHVYACETVHLRARRIDPFVGLTVTGNLLIGAATWWLGSKFGATGVGFGYLAVAALFLAPGAHLIRRSHQSRLAND